MLMFRLFHRYFENRSRQVAAWKDSGVTAYPHKYNVDTKLPEFIKQYGDVEAGVIREDVTVSVAGRIMSARSASSKLQFYDLHADGLKIQVRIDTFFSLLCEARCLILSYLISGHL